MYSFFIETFMRSRRCIGHLMSNTFQLANELATFLTKEECNNKKTVQKVMNHMRSGITLLENNTKMTLMRII